MIIAPDGVRLLQLLQQPNQQQRVPHYLSARISPMPVSKTPAVLLATEHYDEAWGTVAEAAVAVAVTGGILGSTSAGPTTAAALQLAVAVVKQSSGRSFHVPSMLRWMSANVILQLTDPAAVAAAGHKTQSLTTAPCFLQAVITALAVQTQWLLQPAAKGSGYVSTGSASSNASSGMFGSSSLSSLAGGSSISVASTGSNKGWLFGRNRLQDLDTAPQKDQGRMRERLLPSHTLLLECLGLQGNKADELVDAVYREGARPISQQDIQAYVNMYRSLARHMRLVTIGPPVPTDAGRMYQVSSCPK
jgi:hypothetical protein